MTPFANRHRNADHPENTSLRSRHPPPPVFIHVDLDGLWTLAACYGYAEEESFSSDPVFDRALPRLLDLFDRMSIRATFFIVGRDLEREDKRRAVGEILHRGHDLGNHGYSHHLGLESLAAEAIDREIGRTQTALAELSGSPPAGFRAPGYGAGDKVLRTCQRLGIKYDGSMLPTRWGPALRWMARHFRRKVAQGPSAGEPMLRVDGSDQYRSGAGAGIMPQWVRPDPNAAPLLRLPLAVSPILRLPLHASLGMMLGIGPVIRGLGRLAAQGWPITYLLHGLDLSAPEELLGRLPAPLAASRAFNTPLDRKLQFIEEVLRQLQSIARPQLTVDYLSGRITR